MARKRAIIRIEECQDCGLSYTNPIYQTWFAGQFYDRIYRAEGLTARLPSDGELAKMLSSNFSLTDKNCREQIDGLMAISDLPSGARLIELGSSWGYFLYQAQRAGFEVGGVEISDRRRDFGVGKLAVDIRRSLTDFEPGSADLVYTAHVLEHFTDLSSVFTDMHRLLRRGGKLVVEVPNFDLLRFGEDCLSIVGAIHPLGFDSEFFSSNLPKYGFEIVGFFDRWTEFPHSLKEKSAGGTVLLLAERREAESERPQ